MSMPRRKHSGLSTKKIRTLEETKTTTIGPERLDKLVGELIALAIPTSHGNYQFMLGTLHGGRNTATPIEGYHTWQREQESEFYLQVDKADIFYPMNGWRIPIIHGDHVSYGSRNAIFIDESD